MVVSLITKSNFLSYLHCPKKLWLEKYSKEKAQPRTPYQEYISNEGLDVEKLAKSSFGVSVHIPKELSPQERAIQTGEAIKNGAKIIFEASFIVDGLFAAIDVLELKENGCNLIEIKATNDYRKKRKKYLQDVAFQYEVVERAGLTVNDVSLMYLNKSAEWPVNVDQSFVLDSVIDKLQTYLKGFDGIINSAKKMLSCNEEPKCTISRFCKQDHGCPFKAYCWKDINDYTIFDVDMGYRHRDKLTKQEVVYLNEVPENADLTNKEKDVISRARQKKVYMDKVAIKSILDDLEFPLYFLDFETFGPAIPLFKGMHPYQKIPFQFSCHVLNENGELTHDEFLHTDFSDPREFLVASLLDQVKEKGNIVVYHKSFEAGVINSLAELFGDEVKEKLVELVPRLFDLRDIFIDHYKHFKFRGSTSIKAVGPVMTPDVSYKSLQIQKGDQASIEWLNMVKSTSKKQNDSIAKDLREYCRMDTYAMYAIYQKLCDEITNKN
jgi:hypothetical protein